MAVKSIFPLKCCTKTLSLVCLTCFTLLSRYKLLTKEPSSKTISKADSFTYNGKFTDKARKIKVGMWGRFTQGPGDAGSGRGSAELRFILHPFSEGGRSLGVTRRPTVAFAVPTQPSFPNHDSGTFASSQVPLAPVDEKKKVMEEVDKDRRFAIDAAVVRAMKSQKVRRWRRKSLCCGFVPIV